MSLFDSLLIIAQKHPFSDILDWISDRMNIRKLPKRWDKQRQTSIKEGLRALGDWGILKYQVDDQILNITVSADEKNVGVIESLDITKPDPKVTRLVSSFPASIYVPTMVDKGIIFENIMEVSESSAFFPYELDFDIYRAGEFTKFKFQMEFEGMYGLGDKTRTLQRRGRYIFWNFDDADHSEKGDPLYQSHPVALFRTSQGVLGLIVDTPAYQVWDIGKGGVEVLVEEDGADIYFFLAENFTRANTLLTSIIGTFPLPPLWSLGYQQSRWSYEDERRVLEVYEGYMKRDIPLDVIYLDINYMDRYRCFTINENNFPDLSKLREKLGETRLVAIIDAGIAVAEDYSIYIQALKKDFLIKKNSGQIFQGRVWPGDCGFLDFYREDVRNWWGAQYKFLLERGIDGFWNDMNEPSIFSIRRTFPKNLISGGKEHRAHHNSYGMMMSKGSFDGLEKINTEQRNFVLTRSSYPGGQNYAWMWTGDNSATWEFLRLSLRQIISLGLSGQPLSGADVGGFRGTPESLLLLRWTQLGIFYQLFRNHSSQGTKNQEPWEFGDEILKYCREAIRLRYKLLPYIYTQIFLSSQGDGPLVRPMFYFGDSIEEKWTETQFYFGRDILVAPVLEETDSKEVYLPQGAWYDFHSSEKIQGGRCIEISVDLGSIPMFVKEGSVIPLSKEIGVNSYTTISSGVELLAFGEKAEGLLYMDDGISKDYKNGKFALYKLPEMRLLVGKEGW